MTRTAVRALILLSLVAATLVAGCSASSSTATQAAASGSAAGAAAVRKVSPADAVPMLGSRTVIDVRTPAEYAAGHIAGAQNVDVEAADFASRIASLDPKAPYLLYCRSGRRSAIAAQQMAAAGFTDIVDAGGMDALVAAGAPRQ